ncbi:MAG TPA: GTPase [Telluria sp.]|nr:GTPase [Telluria sp.]
MPPARVATTLVTGPSAGLREAAIAARLAPAPIPTAILLEGLADGRSLLAASDTVLIQRIAPGCLCCTGNLVLRVTLNRILRRPPERLYIGLATTEHLDQLRSWLSSAPYDQLLELTPDLST